jgi:hypothetical protein
VNGCQVELGKRLLMCATHWGMLSQDLKSKVWRWYRPGQERTGMPSLAYHEAAQAAIDDVNTQERDQAAAGVQLALL